MKHEQEKIDAIMSLYDCDSMTASKLIDMYENGFRAGVKEGQKQAQRFFRLSLGIEDPEMDERAYWNNPVPLKS